MSEIHSEELSDFLELKKVSTRDLEEFKKLEIILTKTQKMIDQNLLKRYEKNDVTLTRKDIAYVKRMIGGNRRNNATLRSRL